MDAKPSGAIAAIWIKRFRRGPMDPTRTAVLVTGQGMAGNVDQGGRRQITLLEEEVWQEVMQGLGGSLDARGRRANLLLRNVRLAQSRGKLLALGPCRVRIMGETKPCERMEEALPGLRDALYPEWRGGAFGVIEQGGQIQVGDPVWWMDQAAHYVRA